MARQYVYDENKLRPLQKEAALALVEYEFTPKEDRKTKQQIADEIGISRQMLHRWDTQDENFIAYKNSISAKFLDSETAFVFKKLVEAIDNGSVRAIEVFMKRAGEMTDHQEITVKSDSDATFEERKQELLERLGAKTEGAKETKVEE